MNFTLTIDFLTRIPRSSIKVLWIHVFHLLGPYSLSCVLQNKFFLHTKATRSHFKYAYVGKQQLECLYQYLWLEANSISGRWQGATKTYVWLHEAKTYCRWAVWLYNIFFCHGLFMVWVTEKQSLGFCIPNIIYGGVQGIRTIPLLYYIFICLVIKYIVLKSMLNVWFFN